MSHWPPTRNTLLARLADPAAAASWREFQQIYEPAIYRYARHRGLQPADACEVLQEVLLAVHTAMRDWQPTHRPGSFRAWLAETARRITLQTLRQRSRAAQVSGKSSGLLEIAVASDQFDDADDLRRWAFFTAAAEVERDTGDIVWSVFWMTAVQNLSPEVVAKNLGLSIGAIYTAKCRVLALIRQRASRLLGEQS